MTASPPSASSRFRDLSRWSRPTSGPGWPTSGAARASSRPRSCRVGGPPSSWASTRRRRCWPRPASMPAGRCASPSVTWPRRPGPGPSTSSWRTPRSIGYRTTLASWPDGRACSGRTGSSRCRCRPNLDHPSHTVAAEVGREPRFAEAARRRRAAGPGPFGHAARGVRRAARRARFRPPTRAAPGVRPSSDRHPQVVEWMKGTSLTRFRPAWNLPRSTPSWTGTGAAGRDRRPPIAVLLRLQADPAVGSPRRQPLISPARRRAGPAR